jgi:hypothetical protein
LRRIKSTLHKIRNSGISKVEVETTRGEIIEITTKTGIELACMNENNFFNRLRTLLVWKNLCKVI